MIETELLARAEAEVGEPLARLLTGKFPPTIMDRIAIAKFVALQWARREKQTERVTALIAGLVREPKLSTATCGS